LVLDQGFHFAGHGPGLELDFRTGEEIPDPQPVEAVCHQAVNERRPVPHGWLGGKEEGKKKNNQKEKEPDLPGTRRDHLRFLPEDL